MAGADRRQEPASNTVSQPVTLRGSAGSTTKAVGQPTIGRQLIRSGKLLHEQEPGRQSGLGVMLRPGADVQGQAKQPLVELLMRVYVRVTESVYYKALGFLAQKRDERSEERR